MGRKQIVRKKKSKRAEATGERVAIRARISECGRAGVIMFLANYDSIRESGATAREAAIAAFHAVTLMRKGGV